MIAVIRDVGTGRFQSLGLSLEDEFRRRVKVRGGKLCWPWLGSIYSTGYGVLKIKSKRYGAHRLAWEFSNGPIPDGLFVCHKCDNPRCCNPKHLFLGTVGDNLRDCVSKGRHSHGQRHPYSKLSEADVLEIRRIRFGQVALAERFGVCQSTIWGALHRKTWKHL